MGRHLAIVVLVAVLGGADPAQARQRAVVGLGAGGGVILGTRLLEANGPDGASPGEIREVNLEDTPVASAHAEWYVIPHLALRGHIARGTGRLDVQSREPVVGSGGVSTSSEAGRVRITAYDVGLSVWPWAPNSVGFAPFVTVGFGRLIYDFADVDGGSPFEALGSRDKHALILGFGGDMHMWRSLVIRFEAIDHRVRSPVAQGDLVPGEPARGGEGESEGIHNIRLLVAAHVYLPFHRASPSRRR